MSNSLGTLFRVTSFGESHGRCVGVVVDGCPSGLKIDEEDIQPELDRRRPGQSSITTSRSEEDRVEILSGIFKGYTTGAPICLLTWNRDHDSSKYESLRFTPRPGHADYTSYLKYGGYNDYRGGGRFSGRITAGFVMAGAIAKKLLRETHRFEVLAHTINIGGIESEERDMKAIRSRTNENIVRCADPEAAERMIEAIQDASSKGDSLGGIIEGIIEGLPPGVGEPVFNTLEGDLSKALYSIPAIKAVEFGIGTEYAALKGSKTNDDFILRRGRVMTETNNAGGILGGISNGMPVTFKVTVKPTPSIGKEQRTIDLREGGEATIKIKGRHDPCIVPRAVPVVEGVVALILVDHLLISGDIPKVLETVNRVI
ncbi:MAG: chorismate synthase [Candidatus Bathyarchaeia archaeon]